MSSCANCATPDELLMKREGLAFFGAIVASIAALVGIGLALSFVPVLLNPPQPTPTSGAIIVEEPRLMPDFTLTDQNKELRHLTDSRGKAVLVFFGYTHCPDVCPLAMSDFKRVKTVLGATNPEAISRVDFMMVSVDGERDTPDVMKSYVEAFDPQFIGLTGGSFDVAAIGKDYGLRFEKQKPTGTQASYLIAHTSFSYLIDPKGFWRVAFPFQTPPEQIASDIARILTEK